MIRYIAHRILIAIPTLCIISVLIFFISKQVPQDPVTSLMEFRGVDISIDQTEVYDKVYRELKLDAPGFYFSITPNHYPKSINHISDVRIRELYKHLLKDGFKHEDISESIQALENKILEAKKENNADKLISINQLFNAEDPILKKELTLLKSKSKQNVFWPKINWHGTNNQYHNWVKTIFNGGFGASIVDGKTALSKVSKALTWTLSITLVDFVLSLNLVIIIGIFLSKKIDGRWQNLLSQVLYFIYSIPVFWLATVMVVYFTSDEFGWWTNWFPSVAVDIFPGKSTFQQILLNAEKLILPILILTIHSLAYITRFVRRSILDELDKPYVLLAYSKGLSKTEVIRKHVLKNALIPFITTMAASFVAVFGGSLILEIIFNIPGMGRLLINSIRNADWNVVFCITLLLSVVTIVSYLIADLLYAYTSPKISLNKSRNL